MTAAPTVFAGAVMGISVLKQPLVLAQSPEADLPVLVTYIVVVGAVVVVLAGDTTTSIALEG